MERYGAVIVGAGPAGLEAALNLRIRNKTFLLFGGGGLSGKVEAAPMIHNYLGFPSVSGKELAARFREHLEEMDIAVTHQQVSTVYPMGDYFAVATGHMTCEATAVVLATGVFSARKLPGEEELLGRGVGYCATCDAPLYRGRTVAVVGYSAEAAQEAEFLAEVAGKVYYVPASAQAGRPEKGVEIIEDRALAIRGEGKVDSLVLAGQELAVDGVFLLRDTIAPASLIPGIELEEGFIRVDGQMQTNIPGCFAAGDCTGKPHQYMRAAGQGQVAGLAAAAYIDNLSRKG